MGSPSRLILQNHQPFESVEIFTDRVVRQSPFNSARIVSQSVKVHLCRHITSERTHDAFQLEWISANTADSSDIDSSHLIDVITYRLCCVVHIKVLKCRPPSYCDAICQISRRQTRVVASRNLASKKRRQRNLTSR